MKDIIFVGGGGAGEVRLNPCQVRLKQTLENLETQKSQIYFLSGGRYWTCDKTSNKLSLDLHKSGNELGFDLLNSDNELYL